MSRRDDELSQPQVVSVWGSSWIRVSTSDI